MKSLRATCATIMHDWLSNPHPSKLTRITYNLTPSYTFNIFASILIPITMYYTWRKSSSFG